MGSGVRMGVAVGANVSGGAAYAVKEGLEEFEAWSSAEPGWSEAPFIRDFCMGDTTVMSKATSLARIHS